MWEAFTGKFKSSYQTYLKQERTQGKWQVWQRANMNNQVNDIYLWYNFRLSNWIRERYSGTKGK